MNRNEWLRGRTFVHKKWKRLSDDWSHDHCDICMTQIREEVDDEVCNDGYVTYTPDDGPKRVPVSALGYTIVPSPWEPEGNATWICPKCFMLNREKLDLKVSGDGSGLI